MKAAIYCRVSTEDQEKEGSSLQTQLEACLTYCQGRGYDVAYRFNEAYSGLSLERPELDKLRELVRAHDIDILVIYCLDRLSRDPGHGVILTQELEKHKVTLEAVTETVDSTELGKLISYIRGYAAKLEAEKIRERSMRGIRARVATGRLPGGRKAKVYGYNYLPGKGKGEGVRYINDDEAKWVREIYRWYVEDGLTINAIVYRLRSLEVSTPTGRDKWSKFAIHKILRREAYIGKTYAYTQRRVGKVIEHRPRNEWVEIPEATPAIISNGIFEDAQARLKRNKELSARNTKAQYLLSGYVICGECGRRYYATASNKQRKGQIYQYRYYRCPCRMKIISPEPCVNTAWSADRLESIAWHQIENVLTKPESVLAGIEINEAEAKQADVYYKELDIVNTKLRHIAKEKDRCWKAYEMTGDEDKFRADIKIITDSIAALESRKAELEQRIQASCQAQANADGLKSFCELAKKNIDTFTFEDKRLALEALNIRVIVDENSVTIEGSVPIMNPDIASTIAWQSRRNNTLPFSLRIAASVVK